MLYPEIGWKRGAAYKAPRQVPELNDAQFLRGAGVCGQYT